MSDDRRINADISDIPEHVLVGISPSPSNEKIIRTAHKMAVAFNAAFSAVYVKTPASKNYSEDDKKRLENNIRLAEDLGAAVTSVYGEDVPNELAGFARISGATKIVIGRSSARRTGLFRKLSLADKLILAAPEADIHIIPDSDTTVAERGKKLFQPPNALTLLKDAAIAAGILSVATLFGFLFASVGFTEANIVTVYILGVLITSVLTKSRILWVMSSVAAVLLFNFLFTEPRFSLLAYDDGYPVTFVIMLAASIITGTVAAKMKRNAGDASRAAYRAKILFDANKLIQKATTEREVLDVGADKLKKLLKRDVTVYEADDAENADILKRFSSAAQCDTDTGSYVAADDIFKILVPLKVSGSVYAVFGIDKTKNAVEPFEAGIMRSIVGECSIALENLINLRQKKQASERAEMHKFRADLLRTISHDLRTPLTAISGNAANLAHNENVFDVETRKKIYSDIYSDSLWLIGIVENLLSVTKLEDDSIHLNITTELVEEVAAEALKHIRIPDGSHTVRLEIRDELLPARMDARLIIQVILNLVDNAVKYTPRGGEITVKVRRDGAFASVSVADNGPGVPDELKRHIFDMFYTGRKTVADGRRSLGLGLYLCKSIVKKHGGEINVSDNTPSGAVFTFTLPVAEVNINE